MADKRQVSRRQLLAGSAALACLEAVRPVHAVRCLPLAIVGVGTAARDALSHYVRFHAADVGALAVVADDADLDGLARLPWAVDSVMLVVGAGGRTAERLAPAAADILSSRYAAEALVTLPFHDDPVRSRALATASALQRMVPCTTVDFGAIRASKPVPPGEHDRYNLAMAASLARSLFLELHPEEPRRFSPMKWAVRSTPNGT